MAAGIALSGCFCLCVSSLLLRSSFSSPRPPIGVHPLDEKYYDSELIRCRDGSKFFPRDQLNDNFCDCADGTDEPGTSACPSGTFYCRNTGSMPRFLFSSRVNDRICDCCDGSDEQDGAVICPDVCIMGGNVAYQTPLHDSISRNLDSPDSRKSNIEDSPRPHRGLAALVFLQAGLVVAVLAYRLFCRSRRRHRTQR